ncbi:glycosyltransferase WbuB [Desulfovibrio sp. G11]|nr:glycosyltransferase WbuB [Desulfovibrio sp. G11]
MAGIFQNMHRSLTLHGLRRLFQPVDSQRACSSASPRLLYVAASCLPYHISGYTARTQEVLMALRAAGADVLALTRPGYPWDRADKLCEATATHTLVQDVEYTHTPRPSNRRFLLHFAAAGARVIEQYAKANNITRIHAASNHTNALPALIAARRLGLPFQYEMRGLWELTRASRQPEFENSYNYNFGLEMECLVATQADRVFVISEQLGQFVQERWGIESSKIHLLPNCVDVERIKPNTACAVQPNTIGYAGSLINYEGLDTLIDAIRLLGQRGGAVRLHIIGDGEARPALEAQVCALGLQSHVHFLGKVTPDESRAHLGQCSLVCIPRKPFTVCKVVPPIKLVEAMALGKAVIVPDLPVFRDEASTKAVFFAPGDAEDLAQAISGVLQDSNRLNKLACAGLAHVQARRQWKHFVKSLMS